MEKIKNLFKKIRIDTIIRAILLLIMGIMFLVNPEESIVSATLVLSIFIIIDGVVSLFIYFFTSGFSLLFGTTLLGSIFKILFGLLASTNLGLSSTLLSILFSIYLIVVSTNTIEESMYLKRVNQHWVLSLILGIISLIGGITMLFLTPSSLLKVTGIITGVTLIITCIEDISLVISMYKVKKKIESTIIDIE